MRPRLLLAALLLVLGAPLVTLAQQPAAPRGQASLVGTVTDAETGAPLASVNVFIATSTRGTTTDADGRFRLPGVALGAQRLYVSRVGYEPYAENLNLREARPYVFDVALLPSTTELPEVVVEAERDEKWQERYDRFVRAFIGETPNAEQTEILNPEVLSFEGGVGSLRARAAEPLRIVNRGLGYRVEYHLRDFLLRPTRTQYDGEPLFESLDGTPAEQAEWAAARREAFLGSFHHLLLAMLADRTEDQGFRLFLRPESPGPAGMSAARGSATPLLSGQRFPTTTDALLSEGETAQERTLTVQGMVEVLYLGEMESEAYKAWRATYARDGIRQRAPRVQTSQFWLERGPATIDYKGDVVDPYGVTVSGYYAFERVADQLPKEYRP
jgi:hypothetical protein